MVEILEEFCLMMGNGCLEKSIGEFQIIRNLMEIGQ